MAPDMGMLLSYVGWTTALSEHKSVVDAMERFDFASFAQHQVAFMEELKKTDAAPPDAAVKEEEVDEEEEQPKQCGSAAPRTAQAKAKAAAKVDPIYPMPFIQKTLLMPAIEQYGKLVTEEVKRRLVAVSASLANDDSEALEDILLLLSGVAEQWRKGTTSENGGDLRVALLAMATCFQCLRQLEADKPSVTDARAARRALGNFAREKSVAADLGLATKVLAPCKRAMDAALSHSKAGIEDAIAVESLANSMALLEEAIEPHALSLAMWALQGNDGLRHDLSSFTEVMCVVKQTVLAIMGALLRLSPSGLAKSQDDICAALGNCVLVLQVATYVLATNVDEAFDNLVQSAIAVMTTETLGVSDNKEGQHMEMGDIVALSTTPMEQQEPPPASPKVQAFRALWSAIAVARQPLQKFCEDIAGYYSQVNKCFTALAKRSTEQDFASDIIDSVNGAHLQHDKNNATIKGMIEYLSSACELVCGSEGVDVGVVFTTGGQHTALCSFCRIHASLMGEGCNFVIELSDSFIVEGQSGGFGETMQTFVSQVGQYLYDANGSEKISASFKAIFDGVPTFAFVHESVLKECEADRLLPMLILAPKLDALLVQDFHPQGEEVNDLKVFEGLAHNLAYASVSEFTSVLNIDEVKVDFASHPEPSMANMPLDKALFVSEVICMARDVASLAAHLHYGLASISIDKGGITNDQLVDKVVHEQMCFQKMLAKLEGMVNASAAVEVEKQGWRLAWPLANLREWVRLLGLYGGRMSHKWLGEVSSCLLSEASKSSGDILAWTACFEDGRILEPLAKSMLDGRLAGIVASHNKLHTLMARLGGAAGRLAIVPRLQDNQVTIQAVRVAFEVIRRASKASAVAWATEVIFKFQHDATGTEAARGWLLRHKKQDHEDLPQMLWAELEHIAAHGKSSSEQERATAHTSARGGTCPSPLVKKEANSPRTPGAACSTASPPSSKRAASSTDSGEQQGPPAKRVGPPTLAFSSKKKRPTPP